ncbi:MAG TPA: efflux RND transporter periplasmic adaptor subunit [Geobacteraceae bacterium]
MMTYSVDTLRKVNCFSSHSKTVFCLSLIALSACTPKKEAPRPRPPVPVTAAQVALRSVPVQVRAIGNVEAYNTVAIKSQVNGQLAKVHFKEGQDVAKGALLFTIDPRTFEAALKQAEAALAKDQAQERYAREQAKRYGDLLKDGIVTQEQYDNLRTNAEAFGASVAADRAAIDSARVNLSYCTIRSPIAGRTGNLMVQPGNLVKANDNPVLVTINQISPIYATFTVPERELVEIRKHLGRGIQVEAFVTGDDRQGEPGSLTFLDNAIDPATGTIKLKGTFPNSARRLWPGQFVNVVLTLTTRPDAVVVPTQAVQTGQQGQYVFVVKADQSVEQRPVTTSIGLGGETVIEKGLGPGEVVVTDGQVRLVPGAKVELRQAAKGQGGLVAAPQVTKPAAAPQGKGL